MAENDTSQEKTEEATPKRKEDARKKGQVTRSRDFATMVLTVGGVLALFATGASVAHSVITLSRWIFERAGQLNLEPIDVLARAAETAGFGLLPYLLCTAIFGLIAGSVPGPTTLAIDPLLPKLSRLSPLAGFKRMFSARTLVEAAKAILKFLLVAGSAALVISMAWEVLPKLSQQSVQSAIPMALHYVLLACLGITLPLILISVIDVPWQTYQQNKQLKMTRQQVKEEQKDTDGRPEVKSRIRQLQQEMARSRMFSELAEADVVITNPSHYAVGLVYDTQRADAPIVIAKGVDHLAARIREVAEAKDIPIIRSPMLCRALYFNVEIGGLVPVALFVAVAQVLAYVQRLRLAKAGLGEMPDALPAMDIPQEYRTDGDE